MSHTAPQRHSKTVSEARNLSVSMEGKLDDGELLTGSPSVAELVTTDLTITNKTISTVDLVINKKTVPAGRAIQFSITGGVAGLEYSLLLQAAGTDATVSQTPMAVIRLKVESDPGT